MTPSGTYMPLFAYFPYLKQDTYSNLLFHGQLTDTNNEDKNRNHSYMAFDRAFFF